MNEKFASSNPTRASQIKLGNPRFELGFDIDRNKRIAQVPRQLGRVLSTQFWKKRKKERRRKVVVGEKKREGRERKENEER